MKRILVSSFFIIFYWSFTLGQQVPANDSLVVAVNADLKKGMVHRFFLGKHYRNLWSTPVKIKTLNFEESGFTILREGGSRETFNIRLADSLGRQYVARSVKKDLTKALPEHLRHSIAAIIFSDLMSANHPYGPLMVPPLAKAAGVLHSRPRLFAIEGESNVDKNFRSDDSTIVMLIEERPDESWSQTALFNYAEKVVGSEYYLNKRLNDNNSVTDAELFLRTRLLDLLIGDWSRHEDQYRWAVCDSGGKKYFQPIPRDRDHAFYKFNDGLINKISLLMIPKTVTFNKKIRNVKNLHVVGEMLSKMILTSLSKSRWDAIVYEFRNSITDSIIEQAVSQLPIEIYRQEGEKYIRHLKSRRDQFPDVGEELYKLIFNHASIFGSNENEIYRIKRLNRKETLVEIYQQGDDNLAETLLYSRIFSSSETSTINLFAMEGEDRIEFSGTQKGIRLIIYPGPGTDILEIEKARGVKVIDTHDYSYSQFVLRQQMH
ncbi:MAG: hypothetical protein M3Q95_07665 [Bacteroidota bacterium]|nr:hypothetical protein [Bacteroidota bacterium]